MRQHPPAARDATSRLLALEQQLVTDVLRLHRDGSSIERISAKLNELRAVRQRLQGRQPCSKPCTAVTPRRQNATVCESMTGVWRE